MYVSGDDDSAMRYACTKWVITVSRSLDGIALVFRVLAASLAGGLSQFPPFPQGSFRPDQFSAGATASIAFKKC